MFIRNVCIFHLLCRLVALPHSFIDGLLSESDLTLLLKVLITYLLLMGGGGGDMIVKMNTNKRPYSSPQKKSGLIWKYKMYLHILFGLSEAKICSTYSFTPCDGFSQSLTVKTGELKQIIILSFLQSPSQRLKLLI